jgi:acyl-coenzyme A synthetase/AMP-(fatty) acid ligase
MTDVADAEVRARWPVEVPERFNPVVDVLEAWAAEDPDALALVSIDAEGEERSRHRVAQLAAAARRMAGALREQGVRRGDRVFVMLPRVAEWYVAVLGAIRIGAVPMPAPNLLTPKDIAFRLDRSGATVAIADRSGAAKVAEAERHVSALRTRVCWTDGGVAPPGWDDLARLVHAAGEDGLPAAPTRRDDPLFLYFTSGTVSQPKMVLHTQAYGLGHVTTARFWQGLRAGDLHWTVTDSGWAKAAYGGLFGQWHERAAVVQVQLTKPTPEIVLGILRRHGITSFCAPPTLYRSLVQEPPGDAFSLPSLRHCTGAGEPLNPEVIRAWRQRTGLTIRDGYGQTEMVIVVANRPEMEVRPGSMGRTMPGWEVEVLDPDGERAADGVVGELCVRTDPRPVGLFARYEGDPEATRAVFRDGWYHTGDKAARDPDGYFWFEGRNDDVITSSAYRIGPFEVESALIEHPAVAEAAVVGRDDPERTQIVCAFCILADGWEESAELAAELREFVKRTTAPYKYPREVHFVGELPKTVSGKIRRSELRERLRAGAPPAAVGGARAQRSTSST